MRTAKEITKEYSAAKKKLEAQFQTDLDIAWHEKYPDGEYRLFKYYADGPSETNLWSIHWRQVRGDRSRFVAFLDKNGAISLKEYVYYPLKHCGTGTTFNTIEALQSSAARKKCPASFVSSFIKGLDTYHKIQILK